MVAYALTLIINSGPHKSKKPLYRRGHSNMSKVLIFRLGTNFANYILDRVLVPRTCKELRRLISAKEITPLKMWYRIKQSCQNIKHNNIRIHVVVSLIYLDIKRATDKTTFRFGFIPIKVEKIKKTDDYIW